LESDTIHLHRGMQQVRLNLKRLFKIEQASVKLIGIIPVFFLVETLNWTVLTQSSQTYIYNNYVL